MASTARYASEAKDIAEEIRESVWNDEAVSAATETAVQTMTVHEWETGVPTLQTR